MNSGGRIRPLLELFDELLVCGLIIAIVGCSVYNGCQ